MRPHPPLEPDEIIGDFADLLRQLDQPCDRVMIDGGYANLMARLGSCGFRGRYEPSAK